nr:hypothetical protein [Methanophagales archaeon]
MSAFSKRIHVNPDLKWRYNTTVKINVRGDNLSDVAVPIELSSDVYNSSLKDGSDIRVFRGEEEVPFWVAWFSPNGSVLFTNVSVPCTLRIFYGCPACADVLSPSNASAVASFYEDWSNYIEYGEHIHFYGWSNPRLCSADGFVKERNGSLVMNITKSCPYDLSGSRVKSVCMSHETNISSYAPILSARMKVMNSTSSITNAYLEVRVKVSGHSYALRYGYIPVESGGYDFNITPPDGKWHHIYRNLRDDLESRGVVVGDDAIKVESISLCICGDEHKSRSNNIRGEVMFDDIAILNSHHSIVVGSMERPNLRVYFVSAPEEARLNRTVPVVLDVTNPGSNASAFNISLTSSKSGYTMTKRIPGIESMSNLTVQFNWTPSRDDIPSTTLIATVDSANEIEEANENDNKAIADVSITAPELFIINVSMLGSELKYCFVNASNTIEVTVKNDGAPLDNESFNITLIARKEDTEDDVPDIVTKRVSVKMEEIKERYYTGYSPTDTAIFSYYIGKLQLNWTPRSKGKYNLTFILDSSDEIAERDESNNTYNTSVEVIGKSDLYIERVSVNGIPYRNFTVPVWVFVMNRGDIKVPLNVTFIATATNATNATDAADNSTSITKRVEISPDEVRKVEFKFVPKYTGTYNISVFVDANDEIPETNESNNTYSFSINVSEAPLSPPDTPFLLSGNITYEDGRACAAANVSVSANYYKNMSENSSYWIFMPASLCFDVLCFDVTASDQGGSTNTSSICLNRSNFGYGYLNFNITLPLDMPDIVLETLKVRKKTLVKEKCPVNVTISNQGKSFNDTFNVSFIVKNETALGKEFVVNITNRTINGLKYGESRDISFEFKSDVPGKFHVCVHADASNEIKERNEENNERCAEFYFTSADLIVERVEPCDVFNDVFVNVSNDINVTIANIGDYDISWRYGFDAVSVMFEVLRNGSVIDRDYRTLSEINRSERKVLRFNWTPTATGNYTLSVKVDSSDNIVETNESNNVNSTCVEVKEATKINMLMYTGGGAVIYDSLYVVRNATIFEATCKFCEKHGLEAPKCEDNIITEVAGFSEPKLWIYDERNGTWIPEEANASLIVSQEDIRLVSSGFEFARCISEAGFCAFSHGNASHFISRKANPRQCND